MGKIKCLSCDSVLESKKRHEFVQCKCENESFVDGGNDYIRLGGKDLTQIIIWDEENKKWNSAID